VSPTLFESELFGYEAGSFTGGLNKGSKGKLDLAWRGTLFLIDVIVYKALEMHGGNKTKIAQYLGISRKSLYCRLERNGYSQV
jgi:transcriptional regulator with PAS, ATPase and Fis domain